MAIIGDWYLRVKRLRPRGYGNAVSMLAWVRGEPREIFALKNNTQRVMRIHTRTYGTLLYIELLALKALYLEKP